MGAPKDGSNPRSQAARVVHAGRRCRLNDTIGTPAAKLVH